MPGLISNLTKIKTIPLKPKSAGDSLLQSSDLSTKIPLPKNDSEPWNPETESDHPFLIKHKGPSYSLIDFMDDKKYDPDWEAEVVFLTFDDEELHGGSLSADDNNQSSKVHVIFDSNPPKTSNPVNETKVASKSETEIEAESQGTPTSTTPATKSEFSILNVNAYDIASKSIKGEKPGSKPVKKRGGTTEASLRGTEYKVSKIQQDYGPSTRRPRVTKYIKTTTASSPQVDNFEPARVKVTAKPENPLVESSTEKYHFYTLYPF